MASASRDREDKFPIDIEIYESIIIDETNNVYRIVILSN